MAAKLNIGARAAAPAVVVVGLLLATCLLLAATAADASRPLKVLSSPSSEGNHGGAQQTVQSPPAVGYVIETVVVGTVEHQDGAGHRLMNVGMLGGIKPQGQSPGDGH